MWIKQPFRRAFREYHRSAAADLDANATALFGKVASARRTAL